MSLLNMFLGNAESIDKNALQEELSFILLSNEEIIAGYAVIRDTIVFTDKRMILVDKQGLSGKKKDYLTVPYKSITMVAMENAGTFDTNEELKIWVRGIDLPFKYNFAKGRALDTVYKIICSYIL
jgi:hypothetical protein